MRTKQRNADGCFNFRRPEHLHPSHGQTNPRRMRRDLHSSQAPFNIPSLSQELQQSLGQRQVPFCKIPVPIHYLSIVAYTEQFRTQDGSFTLRHILEICKSTQQIINLIKCLLIYTLFFISQGWLKSLKTRQQMKLTSTYNDCVAVVKGPGAYERMKKCLEAGIDEGRLYMFDDAASTLLQSLEEMKIHVLTIVQEKCNSLCSDVQKAFEPLWEDPGTSVQLRNQLLTCVGEISQKMRTLLEEANVEVPSSSSASSTDQPSSSTSR